METRFTPGPWIVSKPLEVDHDSIVLTSDGFDPTDVAVFGEQGHANAHLIAAAPSLYEALEKLARAACGEPMSGIEFEERRIAAFDALALARGESV